MSRHALLPIALASVALASLAAISPANASSSQWYEAEGGRVRLVTTGPADDKGVLQGALEIDLKPGWKTYWRDPGDAGVPPTLDASASSNIASAELSFPAPHRFDDGFAIWAGYKEPVSFPVAFTLTDARQPATIEAKVFLGICETICIPVQATFAVDPASDPDNADDAAVVQAALDALPGPEQPDFGVTLRQGRQGRGSGRSRISPASRIRSTFSWPAPTAISSARPSGAIDGERLLFSVPILRAARTDARRRRAALHAGHGRRRGFGNAALSRRPHEPIGRSVHALDKCRRGGKSMVAPDGHVKSAHCPPSEQCAGGVTMTISIGDKLPGRHVQDDDAGRRQGHHDRARYSPARRSCCSACRARSRRPAATTTCPAISKTTTPSSPRASTRSRSWPSTTIT